MAIKTVFITTVGTGTYTIPSDFASLVSVEGIGGGGGGGFSNFTGGGGAYAKSTAIVTSSWTPGTTTVSYQVGSGGGDQTAGTDTWFGSASPSTTTGILAKGGGSSSTGGAGGSAASCVGTTVFSGGSGASGGGGGGGAAGPGGVGGNGSTGDSINTGRGGGGGGASLTAAGSNAGAASASASGAGGNGGGGTGGGASVSVTGPGNSGTAGTGGGGSGAFGVSASNVFGGNGGTGSYWTQTSNSATAGSGGGAGGSSGQAATNVSGGLYGGGAGSAGSSATFAGAQGIIVFTYDTQSSNPALSGSGYKFRILNSDGTASSTVVDFDDMFVKKDLFLDAGLYANGRGTNSGGSLGTGSLTSYSSPIQIGALTNWKQVSGGSDYTLAVKTDGSLWAWGRNGDAGQLGNGSTTSFSSPIQIGGLYNWSQVAGPAPGGYTSAAVKTDGTLWTWGLGTSGELGIGNTLSYSSPVQVGTLTNWKQVDVGSRNTSGFPSMVAVKTDGTLWTWGNNTFGQLGNGNTTYYSSPVQVGALTNWKYVTIGNGNAYAIKTDGTLWAWGKNEDGQLGNGNRTYYSSPIQIGALTNWKQIDASDDQVVAIKTDGTLWVWGTNGSSAGRLGIGSSTAGLSYSSPIQIGTLTNWKQVSIGLGNVAAIKTDGTLWAWGGNSQGELGVGNTAQTYSSPVQVGSLTNWKYVACMNQHRQAISSPDIDTFVTDLTSLLLHFNGANASTTFTDSGPYGLSVTGGGNAQLSTAQFKFGTASVLFDGNGDSLQLPSSSALDFGIAPFTVEFWMRTNGTQDAFSLIISRHTLAPAAGGDVTFNFSNYGGNISATITGGLTISASSATANDGNWHHIAISRDGVNLYLGVDGTIVASSSSLTGSESVTLSSGRIGRWQGNDSSDNNYNGYLDEFRVTKGAALYTTTYTVPIGEF